MNSNFPHQQQQPPAQQLQPSASIGKRRAAQNLALDKKLEQMALPLAPLVQLTTGQVHPAFPATLLGFWLLTDDQLDGLAGFYHQRSPSRYSRHYPCPITAWRGDLALEEKRRKMGKFIGLRGCETPATERRPVEGDGKTEEEVLDEARRARLAEDAGDEALRRKAGWC